MAKNKPRFQKPTDKDENRDEKIDKFAQGQEQDGEEQNDNLYPWEHPGVRDENRMITLYIPEAVKLKLKYLSKQTGVPQQRIMRDILIPEIEERLKDVE